jgi:hypothetical protein
MFFLQLGFSMNLDTLESSSILIYSELHAGFYTEWFGLDTALFKW